MTAVLDLHEVSAGYGPFRALFDVTLAVQPGEAVALLGPNGVGKTTIARVATGLVAPTEGAVLVDGEDMTGAPVHRFRRAGVIHAPEGRSVFATLTVEENLVLSFRASRGRRGVAADLERAFELFPALANRRHQVAGTLSGGEQRMLAMARVLVEEPKLLVADELSLGLAPIIVDEVYASLERLRAQWHRAAHRRAARRPCAGALRSGGAARPWRDHVGGAVLRRGRSRRDGRVRTRVAQRDARAAAMAASAAFSVASLPFLASVNIPGIRWGCFTK